MYAIKRCPMVYGIVLLVVGLLALQGLDVAQAAEESKPERLLTMAVEYPSIITAVCFAVS
jgi:hypothetical protein